MIVISLPDGYEFVILGNVLISLLCLIVGFALPGGIRHKVFNKKFLTENFEEELKTKQISAGGYPDMGQGRVADKLPMKDWLLFNNAQRAHGNFLETLTIVILMAFVSGLYFPRLTVISQLVYIVGRILYSWMYTYGGPDGRLIGALILDAALLVILVCAVYTPFSMGGGVTGLLAFVLGGGK
eukprot:UN02959